MGFITRVQFTLVPELFFTGNFVMRPTAEVLGDIPKTCAENDFWRIEWIANNDVGLFWNALKAPDPGNGGSDYPVDQTEGLLKMLMDLDNDIFKNGAFLNMPLQFLYDYLTKNYPSNPVTGPMRYIIPCDRLASATLRHGGVELRSRRSVPQPWLSARPISKPTSGRTCLSRSSAPEPTAF